jgi:fimbrial chaperone protein
MATLFKLGNLTSAVVATALFASSIEAYDISPLVLQLDPTGPGSTGSVLITNSHTVPIAIEIKLFERTQQADGSDALVPEKGEFVVIPSQMVIAPGSSQSIRVQWTGDSSPKKELAYRLVTEQLPIQFEKRVTGDRTLDVKVQYRYEAALYISAPNTQPSANVTSARLATSANGEAILELHVANSGKRRAILNLPKIDIETVNGEAKVSLSEERVGALNNLNILAGSLRVVRLPWPKELPQGEVTVKLQTGYASVS